MKKIITIFEVLYRTLRAYPALAMLKFKKPELYKKIKSNRRYKNLHNGQRCFIVGNGPSLNTQDVSLLKDEVVFTVNFISNFDRFAEIKTNYHFFGDLKDSYFDPLNNIEGYNIEAIKAVNTPGNKPEVFFIYSSWDALQRCNVDNELNTNFFMPNIDFRFAESFRYNFSGILSSYSNTIHYTIAMAVYMGFSDIYLIGCDCSFHQQIVNRHDIAEAEKQYQYRHAYSESEETIKTMAANSAKIMDMENFYEGGYLLFRNYRLLDRMCRKKGIKLVNCTNGGFLDCLPRQKFEEVIKKER